MCHVLVVFHESGGISVPKEFFNTKPLGSCGRFQSLLSYKYMSNISMDHYKKRCLNITRSANYISDLEVSHINGKTSYASGN